jgi:hypothetical protein
MNKASKNPLFWFAIVVVGLIAVCIGLTALKGIVDALTPQPETVVQVVYVTATPPTTKAMPKATPLPATPTPKATPTRKPTAVPTTKPRPTATSSTPNICSYSELVTVSTTLMGPLEETFTVLDALGTDPYSVITDGDMYVFILQTNLEAIQNARLPSCARIIKDALVDALTDASIGVALASQGDFEDGATFMEQANAHLQAALAWLSLNGL